VLHVIAPTRRMAMAWCRQENIGITGMRWISRPGQLRGLPAGTEVVLVNRGMCVGTVEAAMNEAYAMENDGRITIRLGFTR
jgi:hypothetical protein